jgi:hypothetical protein
MVNEAHFDAAIDYKSGRRWRSRRLAQLGSRHSPSRIAKSNETFGIVKIQGPTLPHVTWTFCKTLREVTPSYAKIREQHEELRTNSPPFEALTSPFAYLSANINRATRERPLCAQQATLSSYDGATALAVCSGREPRFRGSGWSPSNTLTTTLRALPASSECFAIRSLHSATIWSASCMILSCL